jgi:FAD/FMN-containing dehydrogenase
MNNELIAKLRAIVGTSNTLTRGAPDADLAAWERDWRGLQHGRALAVVRPTTTAQVADVMRACAAAGISLVPQGGNTGLVVGATPDASGQQVVLSLLAMTQVRKFDAANASVTVEAGCVLQNLQELCAREGYLFPLSLGAEGSCTIGGNLATNAGGTQVIRFGNARDLCLGLEVVTADGEVWSDLSGLRKNNTGYDLRNLFVGSEGTLGIITAAVLKLMPLPRATAVTLVAVPSPHAAVQLLTEAKRIAGQAVTAFELISAPALTLVLESMSQLRSPLPDAHDWMVLIELSSGGDPGSLDATLLSVLEEGMTQGHVLDAAVAASGVDAQNFWRIREEISDAQTREGGSIKCDISIPLSKIADFIAEASAAVLALAPDARMVIYGHMGDGNVHFNPLKPKGASSGEFLEANYARVSHAVDGLAHRQNGSISAEHGVGVAKRDDLSAYKSEVELGLMWQIKRALDPDNLLNPAKVLPQGGRVRPSAD